MIPSFSRSLFFHYASYAWNPNQTINWGDVGNNAATYGAIGGTLGGIIGGITSAGSLSGEIDSFLGGGTTRVTSRPSGQYDYAGEANVTDLGSIRNPSFPADGTVGGGTTTIRPFELEITHSTTMNRREFSLLKQNIAENGITDPIKYVEYNGNKYVVDGHHRLQAAKELGIQYVPAEKVQLPYKGYYSTDDLRYSWH
ncbi:MAG: ParB N-terminal domain-containing protein [Candidatus Melainabacteria bacterium]